MLELDGLTKNYRGAGRVTRLLTLGRERAEDCLAVDRVSLSVAAGEIVGLLGPNGSGKTTLLRCAAGLLTPDEGRVLVDGESPSGVHSDVRARVGLVMREDRTFHHRLNAHENLEIFARLHQMGRKQRATAIERALHLAQIESFATKPYRTYSAGMRARLALGRALLAEPKVLLLDEATSGLDPGLRVTLHRTFQSLANSGTAILFATHALDEAETLCDRVAVLNEGRRVAVGPWDQVAATARTVFGLQESE